MKIFCTASSDSYITDKIIDGRFRAEDSNVGKAGTLDLFKLWGETALNTTGSLNEISRLLVKFDYQKLHELTSSKLDINSPNFKAELKLFDIRAGNTSPSNFNVVVFPLSRSFDEGVGRDVISFADLDVCNFLTASYSQGVNNTWYASGANAVGPNSAVSIDIFATADFNDGIGNSNIFKSQHFEKGSEDLSINITNLVSASLAGQIKNHGFRISFSGSDETDAKTRFAKRFASRHVADPFIRPRIEVSFDDSIQDSHRNFFCDLSGSLFLNSYERSGAANLVSGSSLTQITGHESLFLKLKSGSFEHIVKASQFSEGTINSSGENFKTGIYSASLAIPSNSTSNVYTSASLAQWIAASGSIELEEYWYSLDGNVGFYTGSLTLERLPRYSANFTPQEPVIHITNAKSEVKTNDELRYRIFGRDIKKEYNTPVKSPISLAPIIFDEVYYRVKDVNNGQTIVDFDEKNKATRVSTDSEGMFFDFHADILPFGRTYEFEFLIINRGTRTIVKDRMSRFTVG